MEILHLKIWGKILTEMHTGNYNRNKDCMYVFDILLAIDADIHRTSIYNLSEILFNKERN